MSPSWALNDKECRDLNDLRAWTPRVFFWMAGASIGDVPGVHATLASSIVGRGGIHGSWGSCHGYVSLGCWR